MTRSMTSFLKARFGINLAEDAFGHPAWADCRAGMFECLGTTLFLYLGLMDASKTAVEECAALMGVSFFLVNTAVLMMKYVI